MNQVIGWLKDIQIARRILTILLAGILVFVSTACNGGLFTKKEEVKEVKTLYQGAEVPAKRPDVERALPKKTLKDFEKSQPGGQIQRESEIGDRVENRLNKVKESFGEASKFIREDAKEAGER